MAQKSNLVLAGAAAGNASAVRIVTRKRILVLRCLRILRHTDRLERFECPSNIFQHLPTSNSMDAHLLYHAIPICILCYLAAALPGGLALLNVADAFVAAPAASSNLRGAAVPQAGISFAQKMFSLQLSINKIETLESSATEEISRECEFLD